MSVKANEKVFDLLDLFGKTVLFTCMRVKRNTVPDNLYVYDVRHDDDCSGRIVEVRPYILVNHWGTVICKEPIEMTDMGVRTRCGFNTPQAIFKWMRGDAVPTIDNLIILADMFDVPIDKIIIVTRV